MNDKKLDDSLIIAFEILPEMHKFAKEIEDCRFFIALPLLLNITDKELNVKNKTFILDTFLKECENLLKDIVDANKVNILEAYLKCGGNPNYLVPKYQQYLIVLVIGKERIEMVKLLLKYGLDLNIRTVKGDFSVLDMAILTENIEIIKILIEVGAKPNRCDVDFALHSKTVYKVRK